MMNIPQMFQLRFKNLCEPVVPNVLIVTVISVTLAKDIKKIINRWIFSG